jgi:hypothetical protein
MEMLINRTMLRSQIDGHRGQMITMMIQPQSRIGSNPGVDNTPQLRYTMSWTMSVESYFVFPCWKWNHRA